MPDEPSEVQPGAVLSVEEAENLLKTMTVAELEPGPFYLIVIDRRQLPQADIERVARYFAKAGLEGLFVRCHDSVEGVRVLQLAARDREEPT